MITKVNKIRGIYLYTICAIMIETRTVIKHPETIPKIACVDRKSGNKNVTIHTQQIRLATGVINRKSMIVNNNTITCLTFLFVW